MTPRPLPAAQRSGITGTRLPGGQMLYEVSGQEFLRAWAASTTAQKVDVRHPAGMPRRWAVLTGEDPLGGDQLVTMRHELWDRARSRIEAILRQRGVDHAPRQRRCGACAGALTLTRETQTLWRFRCPRCASVEVWGKEVVGGTAGQGEKD